MKTPTVIVCSKRSGDLPPDSLWADALLCLASVRLHAPEFPVLHAWDGPLEPPYFVGGVQSLRRPDGLDSYGKAYDWAIRQTTDEYVIVLSDDTFVGPHHMQLLMGDAEKILSDGHRLGLIGCRSNYVKGVQNIVSCSGEDRIIRTDTVVDFCALLSREAFDAIGGYPDLNWCCDDVVSFRMRNKGYSLFVSRAYVHHVGERQAECEGKSLNDLLLEARAKAATIAPDWFIVKGASVLGCS